MSGEDAPRPYLENLIVLEINPNKQAITWIALSTAHYRYTPEATRRALLKKMCINIRAHTYSEQTVTPLNPCNIRQRRINTCARAGRCGPSHKAM